MRNSIFWFIWLSMAVLLFNDIWWDLNYLQNKTSYSRWHSKDVLRVSLPEIHSMCHFSFFLRDRIKKQINSTWRSPKDQCNIYVFCLESKYLSSPICLPSESYLCILPHLVFVIDFTCVLIECSNLFGIAFIIYICLLCCWCYEQRNNEKKSLISLLSLISFYFSIITALFPKLSKPWRIKKKNLKKFLKCFKIRFDFLKILRKYSCA